MLNLFGLFKSKGLDDHLNQTKKVKIKGVVFHIKKIDTLSYLDGSEVMQSAYDEYKVNKNKDTTIKKEDSKRIRKYMINFLMSSVVKPQLSRDKDSAGTFVEDLFHDWEMVNALHEQIIIYTYGKKKI